VSTKRGKEKTKQFWVKGTSFRNGEEGGRCARTINFAKSEQKMGDSVMAEEGKLKCTKKGCTRGGEPRKEPRAIAPGEKTPQRKKGVLRKSKKQLKWGKKMKNEPPTNDAAVKNRMWFQPVEKLRRNRAKRAWGKNRTPTARGALKDKSREMNQTGTQEGGEREKKKEEGRKEKPKAPNGRRSKRGRAACQQCGQKRRI